MDGTRLGSVHTVSSVPVTQRVVAGSVAVLVTNPVRRTPFCTVRYRPREVDLRGRGEEGNMSEGGEERECDRGRREVGRGEGRREGEGVGREGREGGRDRGGGEGGKVGKKRERNEGRK